MTELDDVIDLVAVFRSVRGLAKKLVNESEATHTFRDLLPRVARAARAEYAHVAIGENQTRQLHREQT